MPKIDIRSKGLRIISPIERSDWPTQSMTAPIPIAQCTAHQLLVLAATGIRQMITPGSDIRGARPSRYSYQLLSYWLWLYRFLESTSRSPGRVSPRTCTCHAPLCYASTAGRSLNI